MSQRKIVSRKKWVMARKELLKQEKELTRLRDNLSRQRRELPWTQIEKNYVFDGIRWSGFGITTGMATRRLTTLTSICCQTSRVRIAPSITVALNSLEQWSGTVAPHSYPILDSIFSTGAYSCPANVASARKPLRTAHSSEAWEAIVGARDSAMIRIETGIAYERTSYKK